MLTYHRIAEMGSTNGLNPTQSGTGFLSFNSLPPRLWITSEDEEFDETTIQHWKDEGMGALESDQTHAKP